MTNCAKGLSSVFLSNLIFLEFCSIKHYTAAEASSLVAKSLKLAPLKSKIFAAVTMPISLRVEMSRFFDIENFVVSSFMFPLLVRVL